MDTKAPDINPAVDMTGLAIMYRSLNMQAVHLAAVLAHVRDGFTLDKFTGSTRTEIHYLLKSVAVPPQLVRMIDELRQPMITLAALITFCRATKVSVLQLFNNPLVEVKCGDEQIRKVWLVNLLGRWDS